MQPFWHTIIRPCLDLLHPQTIIEIGTDAAQTTRPLAEYARTHDAVVHTIDPDPHADMEALAQEYGPHLVCHGAQSLEVLLHLPPTDCVLIDGDHNWYTVKHELDIIARRAMEHNRLPLVFLHDTAWPYARRDLYYAPERIPAIHRQPWKTAAIDPETDTLADTGFNRDHAHALYAHGIRNGILSAAEDFIAEHSAWTLSTIPGFSGLGILAPQALYERMPDLRARVDAWARAGSELRPHIEALERARISGIIAEERHAIASWHAESRAARIAELEDDRNRLASDIARMRRTRSWRMTSPLRIFQAMIRLQKNDAASLPVIKAAWHALGEPFPRAARYVRHRLLGRMLPSNTTGTPSGDREHLPDVAVIIPCHNYGAFLRDAVESVLAQTHPAADIIIVDDASTDDTRAVAQSFSGRGVRYVGGEWRNVGAARNAGLEETTAPFAVFLDADDMLHPAYLACGARALAAHPDAAIAYTDHQLFGALKHYHRTPKTFDWEIFDTTNLINASAMVCREALLQAGGWSLETGQHADWVTWRRILRLGWRAVHSEGLLLYRRHGSSMTDMLNNERSYAEQAGFLTERVTLCLPLSGRVWAWPLTRQFLETQTYPHDLVHLIILDTSQDDAFGAEVREWLARCDYTATTYRPMNAGRKGLADAPRADVAREIGTACAAIYNTFGRMADTPLTFILEDDVIPPPDAFPRLICSFAPDVISVSGYYRHRDKPEPVCWEWDASGNAVFPKPAGGVRSVGGTGFGCLVIRSEFMRRHTFHAGEPYGNYDQNFFASLTRDGRYKALIDWDCVCRHHQSPDTWF